MNKKRGARPLRETWLRDLFASAMKRIDQETAGQSIGDKVSDDAGLAIRVAVSVDWLEKVRRRSDPDTREALLECFRLGRAARDLRLGEKFFDNAHAGRGLRDGGARGGLEKAAHLKKQLHPTRYDLMRHIFHALPTSLSASCKAERVRKLLCSKHHITVSAKTVLRAAGRS